MNGRKKGKKPQDTGMSGSPKRRRKKHKTKLTTTNEENKKKGNKDKSEVPCPAKAESRL